MAKKIMTPYEEHNMIKILVNKFSRDETVVALNTKMKKLEFELGVLKSDYAELQSKSKLKSSHIAKDNKIKEQKDEIRKLIEQCRDLKYQLTANNIPIPKKYL